jgi:hypothetical protein
MPFAPRFLTRHGLVQMAGRTLKRYHVSIDDAPIEAAVVEAAHAILPRLLPAPDATTPPASFVILHRGRSAAYLMAYSWVWDNVIECHSAAAGEPVLGCPDDDPTHFTMVEKPWVGCVWELAPFGHERSAWVRHLLAPERPDLDGYLADFFPEGPAGGGD